MRNQTLAARRRALTKRHAAEVKDIAKRLRVAIKAIRSARAEYLAPAMSALRALLAERSAMVRRHRKEREAAGLEIREARAGLAMRAADWPKTKARRIDAARSFATGATGAEVARSSGRLAALGREIAERRTARARRSHALEVGTWGKRVSPKKAMEALSRRASTTPVERNREFRMVAEDSFRSSVETHHPEFASVVELYLKRAKPFSETRRKEWVEWAAKRSGRKTGPDAWAELETERFAAEPEFLYELLGEVSLNEDALAAAQAAHYADQERIPF
jgi:hypothetical protein